MNRIVNREGRPQSTTATLTLLIGVGLANGLVAGSNHGGNDWIVSAFLVVSLIHFWYDAFTW